MKSRLAKTPFDEGAQSVKLREDARNPYEKGSVQFGNFELGRAYALRTKRGEHSGDLLRHA